MFNFLWDGSARCFSTRVSRNKKGLQALYSQPFTCQNSAINASRLTAGKSPRVQVPLHPDMERYHRELWILS